MHAEPRQPLAGSVADAFRASGHHSNPASLLGEGCRKEKKKTGVTFVRIRGPERAAIFGVPLVLLPIMNGIQTVSPEWSPLEKDP